MSKGECFYSENFGNKKYALPTNYGASRLGQLDLALHEKIPGHTAMRSAPNLSPKIQLCQVFKKSSEVKFKITFLKIATWVTRSNLCGLSFFLIKPEFFSTKISHET